MGDHSPSSGCLSTGRSASSTFSGSCLYSDTLSSLGSPSARFSWGIRGRLHSRAHAYRCPTSLLVESFVAFGVTGRLFVLLSGSFDGVAKVFVFRLRRFGRQRRRGSYDVCVLRTSFHDIVQRRQKQLPLRRWLTLFLKNTSLSPSLLVRLAFTMLSFVVLNQMVP